MKVDTSMSLPAKVPLRLFCFFSFFVLCPVRALETWTEREILARSEAPEDDYTNLPQVGFRPVVIVFENLESTTMQISLGFFVDLHRLYQELLRGENGRSMKLHGVHKSLLLVSKSSSSCVI
jgi:hypothetical protein